MTREEKDEKIRNYLKEQGFRPRKDKDVKTYIKQLNTRLGRENKRVYITDIGDDIKIYIGDKKPIIKKTKSFVFKLTEEEEQRYKELATKKNVSLSKLIRDALESEYNFSQLSRELD